ncbi:MAG TPA: YggT family protein [Methylophilaceae bacterium]|nr:YggT family protein [Methylophilaceae bacterium]
MIANALAFILQTLLGLFTLMVLLRFYLQLTGAPFQNPVSQAVVAVTNFAIKPLRRVIPGWRGLDLSSLFLAYITQLVLLIAIRWLSDFPFLVAGSSIWLALLGLAMAEIMKLSIYIFLYAVIAQAILSWLNPYNALSPVLDALTQPILNPIRKRIPSSGGFDFSPIIVFIIAQLLLMLFIAPLEMQFSRLF